MLRNSSLVILAILVCNCKSKNGPPAGLSLGRVESRLEEASGLVSSINNPGMFWTINDSGNPPEVFLIDRQARTQLVCTLAGIENRDWEDIAIGPGPLLQRKYIYVADIGDNLAQHKLKFIYRFEEPTLGKEKTITITQFDTLILKLPDGIRDTETILIDPIHFDLYMISKREDSVRLYTTPFPFTRDTITLQKIRTMPFTKIVAGSISPDGQEILLKNYEHVYYWKGSPGEPINSMLKKPPVELPYDEEPQGEAITWSLDATEFFTLSEGSKEKPGKLIVYPKPQVP